MFLSSPAARRHQPDLEPLRIPTRHVVQGGNALCTRHLGTRQMQCVTCAPHPRSISDVRALTARCLNDLESALARLDDQALRLVENDGHGSPRHELLSSDAVKQALRSVPGFAEQIKKGANSAMSTPRSLKATAQANHTAGAA
jgi:hypothetical protein